MDWNGWDGGVSLALGTSALLLPYMDLWGQALLGSWGGALHQLLLLQVLLAYRRMQQAAVNPICDSNCRDQDRCCECS